MLMYRKLFVLFALICGFSMQVGAHAAPSNPIESTSSGDAKKLQKRSVQSVVLPDGRVVDRLVEANSAKPVAAKNMSKLRAAPDTPEAWLSRMMDPTKNGLAVKHPELFAEWLDAVTEPRFMTALASVAMSPEAYAKSLGKMADPATAKNWMEFADPQLYFRWMNAGMDPEFYQAIFNRMTDGAKLNRWGQFFGAQENRQASGSVAQEPGGRQLSPGREAWLQMPARESNANPWLINSANYRY
jgi:hypothetical protein